MVCAGTTKAPPANKPDCSAIFVTCKYTDGKIHRENRGRPGPGLCLVAAQSSATLLLLRASPSRPQAGPVHFPAPIHGTLAMW